MTCLADQMLEASLIDHDEHEAMVADEVAEQIYRERLDFFEFDD